MTLYPDSRRICVLSPHPDDAAFSLALALREEAAEGNAVTVLNCFNRSKHYPFGDDDGRDVTAARAAEDRTCLCAVHPAIKISNLNLLDAPLRVDCAVATVCATEPDAEADKEAERIVTSSLPRDGLVFIPLAIGNHVDHRIAHNAALNLAPKRVVFYEDLPYSFDTGADRVAATVASLANQLGIRLSSYLYSGDLVWKRHCIEHYRSQADPPLLDRVIDYGRALKGERVWLPA